MLKSWTAPPGIGLTGARAHVPAAMVAALKTEEGALVEAAQRYAERVEEDFQLLGGMMAAAGSVTACGPGTQA